MGQSLFRKDGTAQGVAKQRLIESIAKPNKRVIYDPLAKYFVFGTTLIKIMGHKFSVWLTKLMTPGFHEHLISRTRFIDDLIESQENMEQYVILGAGYDSRPYRLKLPSTMKVFEVDQQEVQDLKKKKLPADTPNLKNVNFISIDFNTQTITERLLEAGFDTSKPTVFTLEGVSQYITKEAVEATLKEIAELTTGQKTTFYMSYVDQLLKDNPQQCFGTGYKNATQKSNLIQNLAAKVGEPWISFYTHEELETILAKHGYTINDDKALKDLNKKYFTPVGRTIPENHLFNLERNLVAQKT